MMKREIVLIVIWRIGRLKSVGDVEVDRGGVHSGDAETSAASARAASAI